MVNWQGQLITDRLIADHYNLPSYPHFTDYRLPFTNYQIYNPHPHHHPYQETQRDLIRLKHPIDSH